MRRVLSIFVLSAMMAGLAVPFLEAQPTAKHACCIRGGRHHCLAGIGDVAPVIRDARNSCPYGTQLAVLTLPPALVAPALRRISALPATLAHRSHLDNVAVSVRRDPALKRGPPAA